jgi:6-pyruvoyltetrahydropterin/6-carboxytetrahydropterin synthase
VYEVSVKSSFSAAHRLAGIGGPCENIHGHNFMVEVLVTSPTLTDIGVVMDFRVLKRLLSVVLETLDHKDLNAIEPFVKRSPSSEGIAEYIYYRMKDALSDTEKGFRLRVNVWESDTSRASFWE